MCRCRRRMRCKSQTRRPEKTSTQARRRHASSYHVRGGRAVQQFRRIDLAWEYRTRRRWRPKSQSPVSPLPEHLAEHLQLSLYDVVRFDSGITAVRRNVRDFLQRCTDSRPESRGCSKAPPDAAPHRSQTVLLSACGQARLPHGNCNRDWALRLTQMASAQKHRMRPRRGYIER